MVTYTLQFSSHGSSKYHNGSPTNKFTLFAKDLVVHYFVRDGEILDYQESIDIYNELVSNDLGKVNTRIKDTKPTGAAVTNYVMWDLKDPKYVSGSLKVGEDQPIVDIAGYTHQKPILFNALLQQTLDKLGVKEEDKVVVYFNACRE
jgi:hypothetical protein